MKNFIYTLSVPKTYDTLFRKENHFVYTDKTRVYLLPELFNDKCLNPDTISNLIEYFCIEEILILDRINNIKKEVCIIDHVNRSGINFLIGKTPYKEQPQFPDMSKIYNPIVNLEKVVVHTVGIKRFSKFKSKNHYISESIGLIAPLWYYFGTKVFAKNH